LKLKKRQRPKSTKLRRVTSVSEKPLKTMERQKLEYYGKSRKRFKKHFDLLRQSELLSRVWRGFSCHHILLFLDLYNFINYVSFFYLEKDRSTNTLNREIKMMKNVFCGPVAMIRAFRFLPEWKWSWKTTWLF